MHQHMSRMYLNKRQSNIFFVNVFSIEINKVDIYFDGDINRMFVMIKNSFYTGIECNKNSKPD